jgi:hypothetical protein
LQGNRVDAVRARWQVGYVDFAVVGVDQGGCAIDPRINAADPHRRSGG